MKKRCGSLSALGMLPGPVGNFGRELERPTLLPLFGTSPVPTIAFQPADECESVALIEGEHLIATPVCVAARVVAIAQVHAC